MFNGVRSISVAHCPFDMKFSYEFVSRPRTGLDIQRDRLHIHDVFILYVMTQTGESHMTCIFHALQNEQPVNRTT
jgi:hypothetical protein